MEALVMMLKNTSKNTYHPIMYFEHFFAGGYDNEINQKLIRYKSKGHHTNGFLDRQDAINSINTEMVVTLKKIGYNANLELEEDMEWDGDGIPTDVQIRSKN